MIACGMLDGKWWSRPHWTNGCPSQEEWAKYRTIAYSAGPKPEDWTVLVSKGGQMNEQETNEAAYIERESAWPQWPMLPVKRVARSAHGTNAPETGVVFGRAMDAAKGTPFRFYPGANMFTAPATWGEAVEMTAEQIIADGWRID